MANIPPAVFFIKRLQAITGGDECCAVGQAWSRFQTSSFSFTSSSLCFKRSSSSSTSLFSIKVKMLGSSASSAESLIWIPVVSGCACNPGARVIPPPGSMTVTNSSSVFCTKPVYAPKKNRGQLKKSQTMHRMFKTVVSPSFRCFRPTVSRKLFPALRQTFPTQSRFLVSNGSTLTNNVRGDAAVVSFCMVLRDGRANGVSQHETVWCE